MINEGEKIRIETIWVFKRNPKSNSRDIYFGVNQFGEFKCLLRIEVYRVKNQAVNQVLNDPSFSYEHLRKNPVLIDAIQEKLGARTLP